MEVLSSAKPLRTPKLRAVTLGMGPVPAPIITNGAVVGAQHRAHYNTVGVPEDVRRVERHPLTVILTELAVVADDKTLTVVGLHNFRGFQNLNAVRNFSYSARWRGPVHYLVIGLHFGCDLSCTPSDSRRVRHLALCHLTLCLNRMYGLIVYRSIIDGWWRR